MLKAKNTKFSIDWLTHTFNLGEPHNVFQAGCGQTNELGVLRLKTSLGAFAIKRSEQAPKQVALSIEETAYKTGLPLPRPVCATNGKPYASYSNGEDLIWVRVYPWVEGMPYDWGFISEEVSRKVGGLLAAIHALPLSNLELQIEPYTPLKRSGWQHLTEQAIAKNLNWAFLLQNKISILVEWEDYIISNTVSDEPFVPSQKDLHPPNVIRCCNGNHVIIDWDDAGVVNAREEVAKFALVWATAADLPPHRDVVHAFISGYREAGGYFESRGILDLTYKAQTLLWWLAYNVRRDVSDCPGHVPDLTSALLSSVHPLDLEVLKRTAALFQI